MDHNTYLKVYSKFKLYNYQFWIKYFLKHILKRNCPHRWSIILAAVCCFPTFNLCNENKEKKKKQTKPCIPKSDPLYLGATKVWNFDNVRINWFESNWKATEAYTKEERKKKGETFWKKRRRRRRRIKMLSWPNSKAFLMHIYINILIIAFRFSLLKSFLFFSFVEKDKSRI